MVATRHTQSLTDFRQNAAETPERINRTGEAEVIPVNGEARAVVRSLRVSDAMARQTQSARDLEMTRYAVRVFERVLSEISARVVNLARDAVENALAWEARLTAGIAAIGEHVGHAADEAVRRVFGRVVKRRVFERTYRMLHAVDEEAGVLKVIGFRHGMRLLREGEA